MTSDSTPVKPRSDYTAAVLSYLVPGLGQISQGRIGKGVLFLVCLYGLFFYGMWLGQWRNVFLGDTASSEQAKWNLPRVLLNVYNRPQFAGQVWIGMAAWPSLWHYARGTDQLNSVEAEPTTRQFIADFQRAPTEDVLNTLQRDGDKTWDLGWVYTVIAGVLNVLVIYDALSGPAAVDDGTGEKPKP